MIGQRALVGYPKHHVGHLARISPCTLLHRLMHRSGIKPDGESPPPPEVRAVGCRCKMSGVIKGPSPLRRGKRSSARRGCQLHQADTMQKHGGIKRASSANNSRADERESQFSFPDQKPCCETWLSSVINRCGDIHFAFKVGCGKEKKFLKFFFFREKILYGP